MIFNQIVIGTVFPCHFVVLCFILFIYFGIIKNLKDYRKFNFGIYPLYEGVGIEFADRRK